VPTKIQCSPHCGVERLEARRLLAAALAGAVRLDDVPIFAGRADGVAVGTDAVYFARYQDSSQTRVEIWKSDGTPAGTVKLFQAHGISGSASTTYVPVRDLAFAGGKLYFSDENEFFVSDGTAAPSQPVPITLTDSTSGQLRKVVTLGDNTYVADGWGTLYRVNGTVATQVAWNQTIKQMTATNNAVYYATNNGVSRVTNTTSPSGVSSAVVNGPLAVDGGGRLFFTAYKSSIGKVELWKSDPTGTAVVVAALPITSSTTAPGELTGAGNSVYFTIDGALWRSDGTAAGTTLLLDLIPSGADVVTGLTALGDTLYFSARDASGLTDLYRTDSTAAGTQRLTSNGVRPRELRAADGRLYFYGFAGDGEGEELWTADHATGAVARVTDIRPGTLSSVFGTPVALGGQAFFPAVDPIRGAGLHVTDGSAAGAVMVQDFNEGLMNARIEHAPGSDGSIFYEGMHNYTANVEPMRATVTASGGTAGLLKEVYSTSTIGSFPEDFINVNGTIYFSAVGRTSGRELWKSDGTDAGTVMVKELSRTNFSTDISQMRISGNFLYFYATTSGTSSSPSGWYRTDGTDAGTVMVSSAPVGTTPPGGSVSIQADRNIAVSPSGWTYFADYNAGIGQLYLKRTKNSVTETIGTWSYSSGSNPTYPRGISFVGDKVVFVSADNTYGIEPWAFSETTKQTYLLQNIVPDITSGPNTIFTSSRPTGFFTIGNWVYFTATSNENGSELWRTDGTVAGTSLFKEFWPGSTSGLPVALGFFGGKQLFQAYSPETGNELWVTDGTVDETELLTDINPGPGDSTAAAAGVRFFMDGRMYFLADDGVHGRELWTTDGTAAGTMLIADVAPGAASSNVMNMTNVGGQLWFTANDGVTGVNWYKAGPPMVSMGTTFYVSDHWQVPLAPVATATVPGQELSFEWDLDGDGLFAETGADALGGDETAGPDAAFSSDYFTTGLRTVTLRVHDADGFTRITTATVRINDISGISTSAGGHYVMTGPFATRVLVAGGNVSIGADAKFGNLDLRIEPAAAITLTTPLRVTALDVAANASLDIGSYGLVIDYAVASPSPLGTWNGTSYSGVSGLVAEGREGQSGIRSSAADGSLTAIGLATAADVLGLSGSVTTVWQGLTVDATSILAKYTYVGDANLDGLISGDDYSRIDFAVATPGAGGWSNGDFNYDGIISGDDYTTIDFNIAAQGPPLSASASAEAGSGANASESGDGDSPSPIAAPATFSGGAISSLGKLPERGIPSVKKERFSAAGEVLSLL
jgi:ELWxxDGT repeat protein